MISYLFWLYVFSLLFLLRKLKTLKKEVMQENVIANTFCYSVGKQE